MPERKREDGPLGKIPPQALEIERTVLGSMLIDVNVIDTAMEILYEECFYATNHRIIFRCIKKMFNKQVPVDIVTLSEELRKKKQLDAADTDAYLSELVEDVATSANINYHCEILLSKAMLRHLISTASEISTLCFDPDADANIVIDRAEKNILEIAEKKIHEDFTQLKPLVTQSFEYLDAVRSKGVLPGVQTGFTRLDELTTGFHSGDLVVLAGRPSMGKTALCLAMALNAAVKSDPATPVAIFSLEMTKEQLIQRMLCSEAKLEMHKFRTGRLNKEEMKQLSFSASPLYNAPIFIDDSSGLNPMEMRAKARRLKRRENIGMIIIDYMQLMGSAERAENRQQEISQISRALKGMAKELQIPVVALSQLNRAVETRGGDKKPQLSDLRESGAIEQDADLVLFVYREYHYNKENENLKNEAEIIIGKQRNGPTGMVKVSFIPEYASFENLDYSHREF